MPESKHRAPRTRERPRLLVDLSGKASEDLRISTPTLTPTPRLKARTRAQASRVTSNSLRVAHVGTRGRHSRPGHLRSSRLTTHNDWPKVRAALRARLRNYIPEAGEVIWTLVFHEWWNSPGTPWLNEQEYLFWLGADRHLDHSIDEWMNSEYEHICDILCDTEAVNDMDFSWGDVRENLVLAPTNGQLHDAWEEVALDRPGTLFTVPVLNASGDQVQETQVSAQDLMDPFGLEREQIKPVIVIAEAIRPQDYEALSNDEEVYLHGYLISRVDEDEFVTIYIVPPQ